MRRFAPQGIEPDERMGRELASKNSQCSFVMVLPHLETQLITTIQAHASVCCR